MVVTHWTHPFGSAIGRRGWWRTFEVVLVRDVRMRRTSPPVHKDGGVVLVLVARASSSQLVQPGPISLARNTVNVKVADLI